MQYIVTADTDIGTSKETNQDSVIVKRGKYNKGELLMAIICDGMGGLSKGELASATVIRKFIKWFEDELPYELDNLDMSVIAGKWTLMLKDLNMKIMEYGKKANIEIGTTFTGMLIVGEKYIVVHVGDTRVYHIGSILRQITKDQTYVARELERGTMSAEQARVDKRRNMLLQCVGASEHIEPEIILGDVERGAYMLCSDGFRHEITEDEIYESLRPANLINVDTMHANVKYLIQTVKQRKEKDNISVVLIRVN